MILLRKYCSILWILMVSLGVQIKFFGGGIKATYCTTRSVALLVEGVVLGKLLSECVYTLTGINSDEDAHMPLESTKNEEVKTPKVKKETRKSDSDDESKVRIQSKAVIYQNLGRGFKFLGLKNVNNICTKVVPK